MFSNVYMNIFDQYVKRILKCKHYGRYVDDAYIVSSDYDFLVSLIPKISQFLSENLYLTLNVKKTKIRNIYYGVSFLGCYLKPYRRYIPNKSLKYVERNLSKDFETPYDEYLSNQTVYGYLKQFKIYNIRKDLFLSK